MSKFEPAVALVFKHEGGFVNNEHDQGGATNFGISLRFYKKNIKVDATIADIQNLSMNEASDIYEKYFWDRNRYAEIVDQQIANKMLDLSVNAGPATANGFIQKAINILRPDWHIIIDGQIGIKTLQSINNLYEPVLYGRLIEEASKYYHEIAKIGHNQDYLNGWIARLYSS